eukprot:GHVO01024352.1.p2 GENE.GHVO01024352.1~~GHVO01024352.1.p2  ORF type:complete len:135 (-),score=7.88 GHVO01024352.1:9-413(-)
MPFGLVNAPATFQREMERVLGHLRPKGVLIYLDDILIHNQAITVHLDVVEEVLQALNDAGFSLNVRKCHFLMSEVRYLGFILDGRRLRPDLEKVDSIRQLPPPTNVRELRSQLGLAGYYPYYHVPRGRPIRHAC